MWLLQLRIVVPPGLKPSWLYVPNRSGFCTSFQQGNLGDKNRSNSLVTWAKWSNDTMIMISFLATYFHNPCFVVYFMLILSSYIKRKNNYFQCAPKHLLTSVFFQDKKKYMLQIILFCNDWCIHQMDCVNEPVGKNFQLWGRRKFNKHFKSNHK